MTGVGWKVGVGNNCCHSSRPHPICHTLSPFVTPAKADFSSFLYIATLHLGRASMNHKMYYVYILASNKHGVLYTGVTNNLLRRVFEHRTDAVNGFTKRYHVHKLVYYEATTDVHAAIAREKRLKKWRRQWKIELIENMNPKWDDLYEQLLS
jgi:putative endonuclease